MVIKNWLGVVKDNRGEKEKLTDVDGMAELGKKCNPHFFLKFKYPAEKGGTELRVTNKVTVCDQKHKSNTLPLEVVLFGSSKAPNWPLPVVRHRTAYSTHPQHTANQAKARVTNSRHFQISDIKREEISLPVEASNHTECLSAWAPNEGAAAAVRETAERLGGWW